MNNNIQYVMHLLAKRKGIYVPHDPQFLFWLGGSLATGYICLVCDYKFPILPIISRHKDIMKMLDEHALKHIDEHNLRAML